LLFGRKGADMRLGKFLFRFIITIIIVVIIAAGVLIWYIAPDRKLNLNYTDLNIQDKAMQMLKTKKPEITLNNEELNELAKKELIKHMGDMPPQVTVTGAEFRFHGQEVTADINGKWEFIPFGAELTFTMDADGSVIVLKHESTKIKSIRVPAETWGLGTLSVPLKEHLPDILRVDDVQFLDNGVKLTFKLNWLDLPSLF